MKTLQVSRATVGFLRKGHPWVRVDRFTRGLATLRPGEAVTLVDEKGTGLASALADPQADICARVYHKQPGKAFDPSTALARAWERRAPLHQDPGTDCYRVVHGEGDFLPGLRIERYADVFVILLYAAGMRPHVDVIAQTLKELFAAPCRIVIREHFDDLRREGVQTRRFDGGSLDADEVVWGRELGVQVPTTPFADLATGIYVDQRATRTWLRERCQGKRVLNLFAYTGLFSVSLLHAGAEEALDVDLARPCLDQANTLAAANGVADRHRIRAQDCRSACEQLAAADESFDLVMCDPPTAAQGKGGGWLVRRDYPRLLQALRSLLAPDALLLACTNTLGKPYDLRRAVEEALPDTQIVDGPSLGSDLPQLKGFPEGRPFRCVVAHHPGR